MKTLFVLSLLLMCSVAVAADIPLSSADPKGFFYGFGLFVEDIQEDVAGVIGGPGAKLQAQTLHFAYRISEMEQTANAGDIQGLMIAQQNMEKKANKIQLTSSNPATTSEAKLYATQTMTMAEEKLGELIENPNTPEVAKQALTQARERVGNVKGNIPQNAGEGAPNGIPTPNGNAPVGYGR